MAIMNIFAKYVQRDTSVTYLQMGAFRFLCMAVGCFIHARCAGISLTQFPSLNLKRWTLGRGVFGALSAMG